MSDSAVFPLDAPIVAVTVHPDRARVTRRGVAVLPVGQHRVRIGPLPLGLRRDSVRVGGQGPATVLGVDVSTHHEPRSTDGRVAELDERRRTLDGELAELADADEVETQRAEFLGQLAQRAGGTWARALAGGDAVPADVVGFADSVAEQLAAGKARRRELARRREVARDRLAAVERQLAALSESRQPDRFAAEVTVEVGEADAEISLELSYVVEGAGWESSYDVRVVDGPPEAGGGPAQRLTLTWFALVTQRTGEDWPEAELTLSTARPSGTVTVPELDPWYLDRVRPMPALPPPAQSYRGMSVGGPPMPAAAVPAPGGGGAAPTRGRSAAQVRESVATVEQGVTAAVYRPARPVAVPADGAAHRATVAVLELPVNLDHVTAPVRAPEAYLRATVTNDSPHTLLPGPASVFHGADFVAATKLPVWAPGEEVELALGVDDRLRVERRLVRRGDSRATLGSTRRREVEHRVTLANHTPRTALVTLLDQLPVSRDEGIVVRELRADPPPTEREEMGGLVWRLRIEPGGSREVLLAVRVELAKGVELAGWRE